MAFYRQANGQISAIYKESKFDHSDWKNFLNKESSFLTDETFDYNPEKFLYLRARAISAGELHGPNQNGDYFPAEELADSYETFVCKGFYHEHDSDDPAKSFGILLDSMWYPEPGYVECLAAIDKIQFPEFAERIRNGDLNAVSMGCSVESAECSICNNIASNPMELCIHMNPQSPMNVKGRMISVDEMAYEINRGLNFVELSGVHMPADTKAHIFEVKGSKNGNADLGEHFKQYQIAKRNTDDKKDFFVIGQKVKYDDKMVRIEDQSRDFIQIIENSTPLWVHKSKISS